ncbi:TolC family protein [Sphingomonas koreensis]|nr:TolC family protein [Sphingomonas koreensis]
MTLGALFGVIATAINPLFGADALTASGSATARQTLFDFGRTEARVNGARANTRLAVANYRQATLDALAEVETAYFERTSRAGERSLLAAAEQNLARARTRTELAYKAGAASLIDVLDAERQLLSVRDRLATARAAEGRAAVSLFRALGGGTVTVDEKRADLTGSLKVRS